MGASTDEKSKRRSWRQISIRAAIALMVVVAAVLALYPKQERSPRHLDGDFEVPEYAYRKRIRAALDRTDFPEDSKALYRRFVMDKLAWQSGFIESIGLEQLLDPNRADNEDIRRVYKQFEIVGTDGEPYTIYFADRGAGAQLGVNELFVLHATYFVTNSKGELYFWCPTGIPVDSSIDITCLESDDGYLINFGFMAQATGTEKSLVEMIGISSRFLRKFPPSLDALVGQANAQLEKEKKASDKLVRLANKKNPRIGELFKNGMKQTRDSWHGDFELLRSQKKHPEVRRCALRLFLVLHGDWWQDIQKEIEAATEKDFEYRLLRIAIKTESTSLAEALLERFNVDPNQGFKRISDSPLALLLDQYSEERWTMRDIFDESASRRQMDRHIMLKLLAKNGAYNDELVEHISDVVYRLKRNPVSSEIVQAFLEGGQWNLGAQPHNELLDILITGRFRNDWRERKVLLKLILENQQDINTRDENGNTILHAAISRPELLFLAELEKSLVAAGVDIDAVNHKGLTALDCAIEVAASFECEKEYRLKRQIEVINSLLSKKPDLSKSQVISKGKAFGGELYRGQFEAVMKAIEAHPHVVQFRGN